MVMRLGTPGDPDGDPEDGPADAENLSGSMNHRGAPKVMPCDKVVNVYATFNVKMLKKTITLGGVIHYLLSSPNNGKMRDTMKAVLDPAEWDIYKLHFFSRKNNLMVRADTATGARCAAIFDTLKADRSVKSPSVPILLVRCANGSLHLIHEDELKMSTARDRLKYQREKATNQKDPKNGRPKESAKQRALNEIQHGNFLREEAKIALMKRGLKDTNCVGPVPSHECMGRFKDACEDEVRDPMVLREVYNFGQRVLGRKKEHTWEEMCDPDAASSSEGGRRRRRVRRA